MALNLTLAAWVNDGLMAIFFFVVGLEIKRELIRGELADRRKAALPAAAALGGMIVPALIFVAFNAGGEGSRGWGIPIATDIAFAVGVLSLLGDRLPLSLKVFLLALAIVDDLGAIAVIAIFYTHDLSPDWLAVAAAMFALVYALSRLGVRHIAIYLAIALVAWLAVHESGVHATVAGVILGLLLPIGPDDGRGAPATSISGRLEHALHPWTSYVIIPIFALVNAGIELDGGIVGDAATSPVAIGVALGLILGKPIGITLFSYVAVKLGVAVLPDGVGWTVIGAVSMIAGIGFTVSLFVTALAFKDPSLIEEAKIGILTGSAVIGTLGFFVLRYRTRAREQPLAAGS